MTRRRRSGMSGVTGIRTRPLCLLTARDVVHVRKKVQNTKQQERASVKAWGTIKSRRAQNPNGRISAFAPLATEAGRNAALSSPRSFA